MRSAFKLFFICLLLLGLFLFTPCLAYAQLTVSTPDMTGKAGSNIVIPINIDDASEVAGADLVLTFDPGILTVTGTRTTDLSENFSITPNTTVPGQITIAMANASSNGPGSGALVEVLGKVNDSAAVNETSSLALSSVSLYDEAAEEIPTVTQNGSLEVTEASSDGGGGGGGGCFIATAAYGSKTEKDVVILRQFRDTYLLPNALGKAFVKFYYRTSPPLAASIAEHEYARAAVRISLKPLVWGAGFAIASPRLAGFAGILLCGFLTSLGLTKRFSCKSTI